MASESTWSIPMPSVQACPVCHGRGWMPAGFFTGLPTTHQEQCRPCKGKGIIWSTGQPVQTPKAPSPIRGDTEGGSDA